MYIGVSDNFKFVIDTIGIPQYNVYGEEINEEIYYTYNVFSYATPQKMYSKTSTQRFKEVPDNGKWTKDGGAYKGYGTRGEFYVLGTSYSGSIIDNVYFPVDSVPETTPDKWEFIAFDGAYESWVDNNKYKSIEQVEYMKNSKMMFDTIDYKTGTCNSYNLVEYNMSAKSIGLNKARLNTCATWKTMGVISTKRRNNKGAIRTAIFAIKPMAASADIKSCVKSGDVIDLSEEEDEIEIKVSFGADAVNLNDYANEKHIKEIFSSLRINGEEVANISNSKTSSIKKDYIIVIDRNKYKDGDILNLEVNSYLYTEFTVDGLMQDKINKNITINIEDKKEVPVKDVSIRRLQKDNGEHFVSLLPITNSSIGKSIGIIEGGCNLACRLDLGTDISNIDNIQVRVDGQNLKTDLVKKDEKNIIIEFKIPKQTYSSIAGWSSLRDREGNYFKVDFSEIGKRLKEPHILEIIYDFKGIKNLITQRIDSIDDYEINMNYDIQNIVLNKNEISEKIRINEW